MENTEIEIEFDAWSRVHLAKKHYRTFKIFIQPAMLLIVFFQEFLQFAAFPFTVCRGRERDVCLGWWEGEGERGAEREKVRETPCFLWKMCVDVMSLIPSVYVCRSTYHGTQATQRRSLR
jgi:hypothetical protein